MHQPSPLLSVWRCRVVCFPQDDDLLEELEADLQSKATL